MATFDEDIKRITDEILSDGTVDQIIREKVTDGIEKAIASSFNYGKLEKAVKERVEQVLVPFIESYDMSGYIVKLDTLLTEYKKFVAGDMEVEGREIVIEDNAEYEAMDVHFEFEEEGERSWSSFKYATIDFTVDDEEQQDELNRTVRLSHWTGDRKAGWEIRTDTNPDIYSLRHMNKFDLLLAKLQRADARIIIDETTDEDSVYSDTKPEPTYE